jgi:hypothetical protein
MNQDLYWLAINEPQWAMDDDNYKITKHNGKASYVHYVNLDHKELRAGRQSFSRSQWQAARDELLAPMIGVVERFLGSPFSTPEEDEEWEKIERRMDAIGQNGSTGEHYSSGSDNDYWIARINSPKRLEPYSAECEDLIELFQMTFQEGEAFKALWRKGQMRIGNGKPGDTLLRNSEKVYHFGGRMVAMELGR